MGWLGRLGLALAIVGLTAVPAHATTVTQFSWDRTGAENLPCAGDVSWTLAPGEGIENATVGVNTHDWGMLKDWDTGSWYITSTEPVAPTDAVAVAYTGAAPTQPTLTLVSCTPGVVEPPVILPPTEQPPSAPAPAPAPAISWDIGFKVTTIKRTNVSAHYRLTCSNGSASALAKGRVRAKTPLVRHLAPSIDGATSCFLTVRAWDTPPHVRPHNWPSPVVTTWVNPS